MRITTMFLLAALLLLPLAEAHSYNNSHASVYINVSVMSVDDNRVVFINEVGDEFAFTDVTKSFKIGDKTVLEIEVDFSGEWIRIINMYYLVNADTIHTENTLDWRLYVALVLMGLTLIFGGYLIGNNNKRSIL